MAASMNILNIDTDMIIPKQFLKTIKRSGLGSACSMKCVMIMMAVKTLILFWNKPAYRNAEILVAGDNFGMRVQP